MPNQRATPRARRAPAVVSDRADANACSPLVAFLERYSLVLALLAVAIGAARIVATYNQLSVTTDEPGHFACGLQYVSQHIYRYESQHPPLTRAMMALPPYLDGVRLFDGDPNLSVEGMKILAHAHNPDRLLDLMRLGILPFFLLACFVVYWWARHSFGGAAACVAVALFTLLPQVLADSGLATTDMGLAACLGAAFYALIRWAESPTWPRSIALGFLCALAALSKFTSLAFLPGAAILALLGYLWVYRPGAHKVFAQARRRLPRFAAVVVVGALTVWAAYFFSFGRAPGWSFPLPAPEFFDGISSAATHTAEGHNAYLFGKFSQLGWWYYFPVALAVKTPIGFLLLLVIGLALIWKYRFQGAYLPLAFSLGVLLPSMAGHVDIGLRHVLAVYLGFAILAALAVVYLLRRGTRWTLLLVGAAVLWMMWGGARAHPDYLAYFNEFAGDTPEDILLDSNFDWRQDFRLLARRLKELNVHEMHCYGLGVEGLGPYWEFYRSWYGLPIVKPNNEYNPGQPEPGWSVVSIGGIRYYPQAPVMGATAEGLRPIAPWYLRAAPAERVRAYLLYMVVTGKTPGS